MASSINKTTMVGQVPEFTIDVDDPIFDEDCEIWDELAKMPDIVPCGVNHKQIARSFSLLWSQTPPIDSEDLSFVESEHSATDSSNYSLTGFIDKPIAHAKRARVSDDQVRGLGIDPASSREEDLRHKSSKLTVD